MPKLSVVICVYNEEENVRPLVEQIFSALDGMDYEIVYVDDGSTDNTVGEINAINSKRIRLVRLSTNYGQSPALAAGIAEARGEYIVTMDGDLQNDPLDIPMMLKMAEEGDWDMVAGVRANRRDGMVLRKIPSKIANAIIRKTTGVKMKDYGCTLKVFRSETAKRLGLYGELHRFIPVLASFDGARITQVDVRHHARQHGSSKYGINRTLKVVSDLLLMLFFKKYLHKPMHLFGNLGLVIFGAGALIDAYMLVLKVLGNEIWGKPLLLLGILLTIMGLQIINVGIILEVLTRTYYESQDKKPYRVKSVTTGEN
ncbi:MAG: glycosyltransferase family 2 protein [Bacteroidales bacterium]|nr:glycosyltransferase family 2 protein [Bacteroidales bacterium]